MTTIYTNVLFIYLQAKYLVCSHRYSQFKVHIYGNSFLFHPNLLSTARILGFFRCHTKCPQNNNAKTSISIATKKLF